MQKTYMVAWRSVYSCMLQGRFRDPLQQDTTLTGPGVWAMHAPPAGTSWHFQGSRQLRQRLDLGLGCAASGPCNEAS